MAIAALPLATTEYPGFSGPGDPPLVEFAAPLVVEADQAALVAGPEGEIDPEIQERMEQHAAELRTELVEAGGPSPTGNVAAVGSGITVTYNPAYPAPTSVRSVIDAAVALWNQSLYTTPNGPVVVDVSWDNLNNPGLLGYAGPDGMYAGGGLPSGTLYPAGLTNTLLGLDANGSSRAEVNVVLNSQLLDNNRWHLAVSGSVPSGKIDLYSVVLHEVGHGLGFLGSATLQNGSPALHSTPYTFDKQASWNSTAMPSVTNQGTALRSGDVFINISDSEKYELYAPGTWLSGSSYSHFDENLYPGGSAGAMMTPMLGNGESARIIDSTILGVLGNIGWPVKAQPTTPAILNTSASYSSTVVSWDRQLWKHGVAPDQYRIEAWRNGSSLQSTAVVQGSQSTGTVWSLSPGTSYTIKVVPVTDGEDGQPAVSSVALPSGGEPADPSEWPNYIRNTALDGQINRLYQAYFLRLPDQGGFSHWLSMRIESMSLAEISSAFASSSEFQDRYGTLSNEAFVDLVYANVLNRSPDAGGRNHWIAQLNGGMSRGEVMVGFAESSEYVGRTGTAPSPSPAEAKVTRLYNAFFDRNPDTAGLGHWSSVASNGTSLESIAESFVDSDEFRARYGTLNDAQFVELVYLNVLGRSPDASGRDYWVGRLASGMDRGAVMVGFSESAEFVRQTGTIP